jgi:iron complex outermembrane receptor protein
VSWSVRVVAIVTMAWLQAALASAQTQTVSGRVVDSQGGAVVGAQVSLSRNVQRRVAKTGMDGAFAFEGVEAGRYGLVVESPGFMAWSMDITVGAGFQPVNVTLQIAGVVEDVQVSGEAPYNLTKPAPTASRLGLSPLETPASVSVVSGDLIRGLGTPTLIVAKSLAPGITSSAPMGSGGNILNARGFTGVNSVKQLFNGMEIYNAGGVVSFPFDPWNVDHIGVLSGPASVLYGTGAIGGAVNVVPRRPDPTTHRREVQLGVGRWAQYHEAIDLTGPLNEKVSYRFDASLYNFGHWVERGESSSQAISGSVRVDATPKLRFTISNDFGNQDPSKYLGTPVLNNAPVEGLRYTNFNVLDAKLNFTDNWTNVETLWTPSNTLSYHNNTYFLYHDRIYRDAPNYAYVPATNQVRRTQFRDINNTYETQFGNTGYLRQSGRVAGMRNEVLVGFDLNRNYYHRYDNVRGGTSLVSATGFNPGNYLDFYNQEAKPFYRIDVDQGAVFGEDQLHVTDRLSGVVGIRRDQYHVNRKDDQTFVTTESDHGATGWHTGLVFEPMRDLALYVQYARASDPVNSLSSIAANQQGFHLSPGRQIEFGVKQTTMGGRAEWTFAVYDLMKKGLLTPSVINPTLTDQVGQQSSRGVEGAFTLTAGQVRVNVNGTVLRARFDDFRAVVAGGTTQLAGNVPLNVPERSANLMVFWDPTPRWQARGVARIVGRRFADNTNVAASRIPAYQVVDLGLRWRATPKLSIDGRVDNVTDEIYADSGSSTQWLLGAPRSAALSLNVLF